MGRRRLFVILPISLVLSTLAVFFFAARWLGSAMGTMIGMCFYWLWCVTASALVHGRSGLDLLQGRRPLFVLGNWWVVALWASTIMSPLFIYDTIGNLSVKPVGLVLLAVPLATINGFCEEVFWRGLFVREFPRSAVWAVAVPSVFFALFHFGPSLGSPRQLGFVFSTLPLGLVFGATAFRTRSALWTAVAHAIGGVLAFGGNVASSLYLLLR